MNSVIPYQEILSESAIIELHERCDVDLEYDEPIKISPYIGNYSFICWGESDYNSHIIDRNGAFPTIKLSSRLIYKDGDIVKNDKSDKGRYRIEIFPIYQSGSDIPSGFYDFTLFRFSWKEITKVFHFVLNPELEVIAEFMDEHLFCTTFENYDKCEIFTERAFYFPLSNRDYLIFSQEAIVNCDDSDFQTEYFEALHPNVLYDESPDFRELIREAEYAKQNYIPLFEHEYSEEEWAEFVKDEEDFICKFHDEETSSDYYLRESFVKSFGIIDCKIKAEVMLYPFTDEKQYVEKILSERLRMQNDFDMYYYEMGCGWDFLDNTYKGVVLHNRFMITPRFKGLSIKYMSKYYSTELIKLIKAGRFLIPSRFLSEITNNELRLLICMLQEVHLDFDPIRSINDRLKSHERYGLVSTFQDKTINEIIHIKGGTKYLRWMMLHNSIKIENLVLQNLHDNSNDPVEKYCYNILMSVSNDIEVAVKDHESLEAKIREEYIVESANKEFYDMMSDMNMFGNID